MKTIISWEQMQENAIAFGKRWENSEAKEKQEAQSFIRDFLACFGITDARANKGQFERPCPKSVGDNGFIDYFAPKRIAIEMKSGGKDLRKAYEQVKDYVIHLPAEEIPDLMMVSDFKTIILYHRTTAKQTSFKTKDLHKHVKRFANIAGYETTRAYEEVELNIRAAEKMAALHDALKNYGYDGHDLEVYLVRLLFCLFAEDTTIFPKDSFTNYVNNSNEKDLSSRIAKLFEVLNQSDDTRKKRKLLSADLAQFRYINGGLFADTLPFADFDAKMRQTLIDCCLFDWDGISPAIFGAMFQGVMDKAKRRELGAHYTSEENILKLINPLFMNALRAEFEQVKTSPKRLDEFHNKIANLKFLDPACGCGNFLIITYRELRKLELDILQMKNNAQKVLDINEMLKVSVEQFYGIEIEDFPCQIAQVGMWLMDHQMNLRAAEQFGQYYARLPLTQSARIINGNALRMDWEKIVPKNKLSYILGNPPFIGKKEQSSIQKNELISVFGKKSKGVGNLDYVTAWYYKAAELMNKTNIKTAFVSTNSITQGEQVPILWEPLLKLNVHIDFAYRTFKWSNEAKGKAAVHCVIIGFSCNKDARLKIIFAEEKIISAKNINPYLVDAPTVLVSSKITPICKVPEMDYGSMPIDNNHLILEQEDVDTLLKKNPKNKKFIREYVGGIEILQNKKRWCLWLQGIDPSEYIDSKFIMSRIEANRKFRESSNRKQTIELANTPHLFGEIRQPNTPTLVIPKVSSEDRPYIPIAWIEPATIINGSTLMIPNATLYHFGVLSSSVHMAWMRIVAGRMKSDYQYSKNNVYNNFVWPTPTKKQMDDISKAASEVLKAREAHKNMSLARMYKANVFLLLTDLKSAHEKLNKAVINAYGANWKNENEIVAALMQRYEELTEKNLPLNLQEKNKKKTRSNKK